MSDETERHIVGSSPDDPPHYTRASENVDVRRSRRRHGTAEYHEWEALGPYEHHVESAAGGDRAGLVSETLVLLVCVPCRVYRWERFEREGGVTP